MANQQLCSRQPCGYAVSEGIPAECSRPTRGAAKDDFLFPGVEV
jgi:hypothetical protein